MRLEKIDVREGIGTSEPAIPVVIPSYEPDERLITLLEDFRTQGIRNVIIVNDGSGEAYTEIFDRAQAILRDLGGTFLVHEVNRGKGRALKTAFEWVLENAPEAPGVVTADSDGQHTVDCIRAVMQRLREQPKALVLGVRTFDGENVPWKSAFGNKLTMKVLSYVSGVRVSDTQTGLRGIPRAFMRDLLDVPGERSTLSRTLSGSIGSWAQSSSNTFSRRFPHV